MQLKFQQVVGVAGHGMLHIAGKAVLAAGVLYPLGDHLAAGQLAGVGKEDRCVAAPDCRITLPEQLGPGRLVKNADRLGTVGIHRQAQDLIFNTVLHGDSSF